MNEVKENAEEQEFEQELKEFLFNISNRIIYTFGQERKDTIDKIKKEYNMLHTKFKLLSFLYHNSETNSLDERYYIFTRKYYPVLDSCFIILSHYEGEGINS